MEKELVFEYTKDIATFKHDTGATSLVIVRSPKTRKLFFEAKNNTSIRGAVSASWQEDPVVSKVIAPDTGESMYLLHKKPSSSAENVVAEL